MNINFIAPINFRSYGIVGTNILVELQKLGVNVALFPIGGIEAEPQYHDNIRRALEVAQMPDWSSISLRLYHENDMSLFVGNGPKVGWSIFERNKFTEQHKHHLGNLDKIIVCSKWAKSVILNEASKNWGQCEVIPLGVNRDIFNEHIIFTKHLPVDSDLGILWEASRKKVIFWHQGKIECRKGHDFLHECMKKALGDKQDWELWMSWNNPFIQEENKQWENMYKVSLGDRVRFIPWIQTQVNVAQVVNLTDYALFPSLSEGWCLPCLEALSMGKFIIGTNYSGFTEYLNKDNSLLIEVDEMITAFDSMWFTDGSFEWASPNKNFQDQLISHIKTLYNRGKNQVNHAGISTSKEFTWSESVKKLLNALSP